MYFSRLHAWGDTLEEAFEQCAMAMFGYMTDTGTVEPLQTVEVETQGNRFIHREEIVMQMCSVLHDFSGFHNKNDKISDEPVLPPSASLRNSLRF